MGGARGLGFCERTGVERGGTGWDEVGGDDGLDGVEEVEEDDEEDKEEEEAEEEEDDADED